MGLLFIYIFYYLILSYLIYLYFHIKYMVVFLFN
jgi:hypothetical protein